MRNIVYLLALILFSSCQNDDGFAKDMDFNIVSALNEDVEGKIYTTFGSSDQNRDSISFAIKSGEKVPVFWNRPDMGGEGSFQLYINEELNRRFGYFTNGVSLEGSFTITIEPDSIIVR